MTIITMFNKKGNFVTENFGSVVLAVVALLIFITLILMTFWPQILNLIDNIAGVLFSS